MADTGVHFYLQLHHKVEGDARLLSLTRSERDMFTQMRLMALQGDTPGEINLAWDALLTCLGVRSSKRRERLTQRFIEERRLLSRGSKDGLEVLVIARWTMPQLEARPSFGQRDTAAPRPRFPSDERRARKAPEPAETPVSPLLEQFFDAPDTGVKDAESVRSECGVAAESVRSPHSTAEQPIYRREEKSRATAMTRATPHTPQTLLTPEQVAAAAFLASEGIDLPVADCLAQRGATEALVAEAAAAVDSRNPTSNRAGMLRRAVEAALSGTPYAGAESRLSSAQPPHRHKPAPSTRRKVSARPPAAAPRPGETLPPEYKPPMALLRPPRPLAGAALPVVAP